GDAGDDSYALYADNGDLYIVNNGTMTVTTGDAADDSDAIEDYEAMRLSGDGELTVTTGDGKYASAIYGGDLLVISGKGTYSFSSGIADNWSAAVYAYGLRIEDDVTVTVNAEKSTADDLNGIEIDGDAIISTSGDVTVTVGKAALKAYGIYANYGLSLIGSGNVTVTVGKADYAYGLYAEDIIIDNPGNVSASAVSGTTEGYGIYAYNTASFAGTNQGNTIYAAGSTQAIYNLPAFDPEFYSVKAAEELEAEPETVGLNTTNFTSFKAIEWTSLVKTVEDTVYGDANSDGSVDMKDVLVIRKYIAKLIDETALNLANADANADGGVDMKDVLIIRKYIAKLVEKLGPAA
ncbi:MAG: dockerin type I repeat-containing protein, partial [Clostridia bacterium]|nr:dockerin type I repeat-containing protein [Clostridia bacterium]